MGNLGAVSALSSVHLPPNGSYNHNVGLLPQLPVNPTFRMLTTCSWEQSDTAVKVYVPLRGVQTELLRATFGTNSLEACPSCWAVVCAGAHSLGINVKHCHSYIMHFNSMIRTAGKAQLSHGSMPGIHRSTSGILCAG